MNATVHATAVKGVIPRYVLIIKPRGLPGILLDATSGSASKAFPDAKEIFEISSEEDLLALPTETILTIYNKATGKETKKFQNKATGAKRTFAVLDDYSIKMNKGGSPAKEVEKSESKEEPKEKRSRKPKDGKPIIERKYAGERFFKIRPFTKTGAVIFLIARPEGATIKELHRAINLDYKVSKEGELTVAESKVQKPENITRDYLLGRLYGNIGIGIEEVREEKKDARFFIQRPDSKEHAAKLDELLKSLEPFEQVF